jgi:hypothetical protein
MHPLNNINFGSATGTIKVHFNNGSSVVTGYIVKQPSATKWVVTADGVTHFTCKLAPTGTPVAGQFTIQAKAVVAGAATGSVEHVKKIDGHHITTVEGNRYMWTMGLPAGTGYAQLENN